MKNYIFILLLNITFLITSAQVLDWKWGIGSVGTQGNSNIGVKIKFGRNGSVYVLGRFSDDSLSIGSFKIYRKSFYSSIPENFYIVKYDSLGNVLLLKNLGVGYFDGYGFEIDNDDNFYVSGNFYQDSAVVGNDTLYNYNVGNDQKIFIAKFDSDANPVWAQSNKCSGGFYANCLTIDVNNNVYLFGSCSNADSIAFKSTSININDSASHLYIVKFNSSGTPQFIKSLDANSHGVIILGGVYADDIKTDSKNNIIITGAFSAPFLAFDSIILYNSHPPGWWNDTYIAKFDSSGIVQWAKSYGGPNSQSEGRNLLVDSLDNIYLSGYHNGNCNFDSFFIAEHGSFLLKQNSNGNIKWVKAIIGNNPPICGMTLGPSQSVFTAGFFTGDSLVISPITIYNDTSHTFGSGPCKLLLAQYDTSGNILQVKTGDGYARAISITSNRQNDFYITGDYWFDSLVLGPILINGNQGYYTTFTAKIGESVNTVFENSSNKSITIYPNPFHISASIYVAGNNLSGHVMCIYNSYGDFVEHLRIDGPRTEITRMNLSSGIYFYTIADLKGGIVSGKFIVQ